MTGRPGDRGTAIVLPLLRAMLVVVIVFCEQLVDQKQLEDSGFFIVLGIAAAYSLAGIVGAARDSRGPSIQLLGRVEPALDIALLAGLCYTSGGAFSDVRKAFFVVPLAAAFSERPRSTAAWSLLAVAAFTFVAALAGGHPSWAVNSWQRLAVSQDLYLAWIGAAATLLAMALRARSAHTAELAESRQRLVTHAIESVERERTRLAGALHDSPVQNLIAARHDLRRAQRTGDEQSFARLHEAIEATIADLRQEIFKLHPHVLDHVGLSAALEQVARHHARNGDAEIAVAVEAEGDLAHRQVLFALGRELLANAAKHAGAAHVHLALKRHPNQVELEVHDDGCGIPPGRLDRALLDGHVGLASVTERVAVLGGTVDISTAPGTGTTVRVTLPDPATASPARPETSDRVTRLVPRRMSTV
jgi:two-component system, NarL family, sensor kinase